MRKVWGIAWKDLQLAFASRSRWLRLLGAPALAIYLVGLGAQAAAQGFDPAILVDVLDRDQSPASRALVVGIAQAHEALIVCPAGSDLPPACGLSGAALTPELAQERLAGDVTAAILTIPERFGAAVAQGSPAALDFTSGAGLAESEIAFAAVRGVVTRLGGPIIAAQQSVEMAESLGIATDARFRSERLAQAGAAWGPPPPVQVIAETVGPTDRGVFAAQLRENGFRLSTTSITAMFVMISLLNIAGPLVEERTRGILRRVGMLPVRRSQLLAGRLLASFLIGLLQFAVMLAFGMALGVDFGAAPWLALVVAAAYVLAVAALGLALAAVARTPSQATALATVAWLVLVPLGGGWWPLLLVPDWMQTLGRLSPVAWCLEALDALVFYGGTWADLWLPVGVLLLFAAAFFVVTVWTLDYQRSGENDTGFSS